MKLSAVRLAYFSPTHTTRQILEAIARGTGLAPVTVSDATPPGRETWPAVAADELLVIGAPVYAGRLPGPAVERFKALKGGGGPAVLVAVYGNRAFEDALLELEDIVREAGFSPVAGAAFIGEHSYHTEAIPIAPGRPDAADIARAEAFGKELRAFLDGISFADTVRLELPGNRPFREHVAHPPAAPVTDADTCTRCGDCVSACPVAAIPADDPTTTDGGTCIICAACIKVCPVSARAIVNPEMLNRIAWVASITQERKEPETWLGA